MSECCLSACPLLEDLGGHRLVYVVKLIGFALTGRSFLSFVHGLEIRIHLQAEGTHYTGQPCRMIWEY